MAVHLEKANCRRSARLRWGAALVVTVFCLACATTYQLPPPRSLRTPRIRYDGQGRYVSPYTRDHVLAEWCDLVIKGGALKGIGGGTGASAGALLGGSAMGLWSVVLKRVGESLGRKAAIEAAGGWEKIHETSDVSFDSVDDLAVYLYQFYSAEENYPDALAATVLIYPELKERYVPAIMEARK